MSNPTTPEPKELHKGDRVSVRAHTSKVGKGLTYPAFSGVLLEDAGVSEGWDVVDVRADNVDTDAEVAGKIVSIYCFSIVRT